MSKIHKAVLTKTIRVLSEPAPFGPQGKSNVLYEPAPFGPQGKSNTKLIEILRSMNSGHTKGIEPSMHTSERCWVHEL
jgi:hypothetical protein